jgi:hypothetical protein
MRITDWMTASADLMGPGAITRPIKPIRPQGIAHRKAKKAKLFSEEDSTDASKKDLKAGKDELFEMYGSKEFATGPCGCTLRIGEKVIIEGAGMGKILSRENRILTVQFADGMKRQFDQNFVHHLRK